MEHLAASVTVTHAAVSTGVFTIFSLFIFADALLSLRYSLVQQDAEKEWWSMSNSEEIKKLAWSVMAGNLDDSKLLAKEVLFAYKDDQTHNDDALFHAFARNSKVSQ